MIDALRLLSQPVGDGRGDVRRSCGEQPMIGKCFQIDSMHAVARAVDESHGIGIGSEE